MFIFSITDFLIDGLALLLILSGAVFSEDSVALPLGLSHGVTLLLQVSLALVDVLSGAVLPIVCAALLSVLCAAFLRTKTKINI